MGKKYSGILFPLTPVEIFARSKEMVTANNDELSISGWGKCEKLMELLEMYNRSFYELARGLKCYTISLRPLFQRMIIGNETLYSCKIYRLYDDVDTYGNSVTVNTGPVVVCTLEKTSFYKDPHNVLSDLEEFAIKILHETVLAGVGYLDTKKWMKGTAQIKPYADIKGIIDLRQIRHYLHDEYKIPIK